MRFRSFTSRWEARGQTWISPESYGMLEDSWSEEGSYYYVLYLSKRSFKGFVFSLVVGITREP